MSDYTPGSATGAMASGDGRTTQVGLSSRLSAKDRKVLCDAMCKCNVIGAATTDGKIRKQSCVAQRLNLANTLSTATTGTPTEYRPEVTYDMRQNPPAPIMSSSKPLIPHSFIPAWLENVWPGGRAGYQAVQGQGLLRRPDVVIIDDPSQPPVQSNIKTVVEMKFPPDTFGRAQRDDYIRIAGGNNKFVQMSPADCGCGDEQPDEKPATSTQSQSDLEDLLGGNLLGGGIGHALPPPPLPPLPVFP